MTYKEMLLHIVENLPLDNPENFNPEGITEKIEVKHSFVSAIEKHFDENTCRNFIQAMIMPGLHKIYPMVFIASLIDKNQKN